MKRNKSAFMTFFKAEFGARPGGLATDQKLHGAYIAGLRARHTLDARREYDAKKTAALRAWMAKTK